LKTAKSSFAKRAITSYRTLATRIAANVTFVVPVAYNLGEVGKFLEATEVIGHDSKFDALWLARKCNVHLVKMVDTFTASRILSNGDSKLGNKLAEVADRYLGIELRKD
jgi:ribonuclease D